jgi:hypothetical protein
MEGLGRFVLFLFFDWMRPLERSLRHDLHMNEESAALPKDSSELRFGSGLYQYLNIFISASNCSSGQQTLKSEKDIVPRSFERLRKVATLAPGRFTSL